MKKLTLRLMAIMVMCTSLSWLSAQISSFPYLENFEAGAGGWTTGGTNSSWALGTPADDVINSAASGTNAWMTNLTGDYNLSEFSYIEQTFDFTSLTAPLIRFSLWYESEFSWDGGVLMVSTDGVNFTQVGALGDPDNWYVDNTINGLQSGGFSGDGWTGRDGSGSGGWVTAEHALTGLAGQATVTIRFYFGSDTSIADNGIAIDDVYVADPPCSEVTSMAFSAVTDSSATIDWVADELAPTTYTIDVTDGGISIAGYPVSGVSGFTYDILDDLATDTEYEVTITPECPDGVGLTSAFYTLACSPLDQCQYTLTLRDYGDGTENSADGWPADGLLTVTTGNQVSTYTIAPGTYNPAGTPPNDAQLIVTIDACPGELIQVEYSGSAGDDVDVWLLEGPGGFTYNGSTTDGDGIATGACPTCPAPAVVAASNICEDAVDLSWFNGSTYDSVQVELSWGPAIFPQRYFYRTTLAGAQTSASLSGIVGTKLSPFPAPQSAAPGLNTNVQVVITGYCTPASPTDPVEEASVTSSFTTPECNCADQCTYQVTVSDTFGDGWEDGGASGSTNIRVLIDGLPVDSVWPVSNGEAGPDSIQIGTCPGAIISFEFTDGTSGTDSEVRVDVENLSNGQTIYSIGAGGYTGPDGATTEVYSESACPSCIPASDLAVINIGTDSAQVVWSNANPTDSASVIVVPYTDPASSGSPVEVTNDTNYVALGLTSFTQYDAYIVNLCTTGAADTVGPVTFETLPDYCAGDPFSDPGGVSADYGSGLNVTTVICPDNPGDVVQVTFSEFSLENNGTGCWDDLSVYNGPNTSSLPVTPVSTGLGTGTGGFCWDRDDATPSGSGDLLGQTLISSDASGCLTFVFASDGSGTREGFIASVVCGPAPTCLSPSVLTATNPTQSSIDFGWQDNNSPAATEWQYEYVLTGDAQTGANTGVTSSNPVNIGGLASETAYDFYVRAVCAPGDTSAWSVVPATATTLPSCQTPSGITASDIGPDSAVVAWVDEDLEGAASFNYEVELSGNPQDGVGVVNIADTTVTLTGLTSNTTYDVYVWADCGGDGSSDTISVSFTTIPQTPQGVTCVTGSSTIVYSEDFEVDPPAGWTGDFDGGANSWDITGPAANSTGTGPDISISGSNHLEYEGTSSTTGQSIVAQSPVIDLTNAVDGAELSFYLHAFGDGIGPFHVSVTTDGGTTADTLFEVLSQFQTSASDDWLHIGLDISAYMGQAIQVQLHNQYSGNFEADIAIDLLQVEACGNFCVDPSAFAVDSVATDAVELSWMDNNAPTANGFSIEIVPAGDPATGAWTATGQTSPALFTGLMQDTGYDAYILADCGTGTSDTIGPLNFVTLPTCPEPTGLTADVLSETDADLEWVAGDAETQWDLYITTGGGAAPTDLDNGTNPDLDTTYFAFTSGTSGAVYDFYVRADCAPGDSSSWVGPVSFSMNTISDQYCAGGPSSTADSNVEAIDITGENGTSIAYVGCSPAVTGVEDLTGDSIDVIAGNTYTLSVTFGSCGGNFQGAGEAWIDWNQNFILEPGESIGSVGPATPGTAPWDAPVDFVFTVPATAANGNTLLRVMQTEDGDPDDTPPLDPCDAFTWGSVADFSVNVSGGIIITCPSPLNGIALAVTDMSADLAWEESGVATEWEVSVDTAGFTPSGVGAIVVDTNYTATGLMSETNYEFFVRAICAPGDTSDYSGPYPFTTTKTPPPAPVGVTCTTGSSVFVITEEFDAIGGWTGDLNSGNGTWFLPGSGANSGGTGPSAPFSGATYMFYEASSGAAGSAVATSPVVDLSGATPGDAIELAFYLHAFGDDMGQFDVSITTDGGVTADTLFTFVGDFQTAEDDPWVPVGIDISAYSGMAIQVQFHNQFGGPSFEGDIAVDLMTIEACGNFCTNPTALACDSVAGDYIRVAWGGDATSVGYDIEYGLTGFTPDSVAEGTSLTTEFGIGGLDSDTAYDFYVKSNCASGESEWIGPITCSTLPDFCGGDQFTDSGGSAGNYSASENITTTICPTTPGDIVTVTFTSFIVEGRSATECWDELFVFDGADVAATPITPSSTGLGTTTGGFCFQSVGDGTGDLNGYQLASTDASGCLTFQFTSDTSGQFEGWTADVACITPPDCWEPISVEVNDIGADSVIISWAANNNQTGTLISDSVVVMNAGDVPGVDAPAATYPSAVSPFNANGLSPETDYEAYVYATCSEGVSTGAGPVAFTTDPTCFPAESIVVSDIGPDTAVVSWADNVEQVGAPAGYNIAVYTDGADTTVSAPVYAANGVSSPHTVSGLSELTDYDLYLITDCGLGDLSPSTDTTSFTTGASCVAPIGITPFAITETSASLSWTDPNAPDAPSYDVYVVPAGADTTGGLVGDDVNAPYAVSGLSPFTTYDAYVIANCAGGGSPLSAVASFTTLIQGPQGVTCVSGSSTIVFSEDFETDPPSGWTGDFAGNGNQWDITGPAANSTGTGPDIAISGSNHLEYEGTGSTTGQSIIAQSPDINLTSAVDGAELSFYLHAFGPGIGPFHVSVTTDGGVTADTLFEVTSQIQGSASEDWVHVGLDISAYMGQIIRVQFHNQYSGTFTADIAVDLVQVEACGDFCVDVTDLTCGISTPSTIDISWTGDAAHVDYDVEVIASGGTPTGVPTATGVVTPSYQATGLTANSPYDFYVRANCASGSTAWIGPLTCSTNPDFCGGDQFVDNGGATGDYSNNAVETTTICPDSPGDVVLVTFTSFEVEDRGATLCWDELSIFDGNSTSSPAITPSDLGLGANTTGGFCWNGAGPGTGDLDGVSILATDASGCLTFQFTSDSSGQFEGWTADVQCLTPTPPANDDCAGAELLTVGTGNSCTSGTTGDLLFASQSGIPTSSQCVQSVDPTDMWYKCVIPASGRVLIDFPVQPGNAMFTELFTGSDCSLTYLDLSCNGIHPKAYPQRGAAAVDALTPGDTLFIRVWEAGNNELGEFEICVTDPVPANSDCAASETVTATEFGVGSWTQGYSDYAYADPSSCTDGAETVWYDFIATDANQYIVARAIGASDYDAVIEVYDACGGTSLGCFNNYGAGAIERAMVTGLVEGDSYKYSITHAGSAATASNDDFETGVRRFADGSLDPAFCGVTDYILDDAVYASRDDLGDLYSNPNVPVKAYGFRFQETTDGVTPNGNLDIAIQQPDLVPYIQLDDVPGLEYGKLYLVSVQHRVKTAANGGVDQYWSNFQAECLIGLEATVPTTQLVAEYCPSAVDLYLEEQIQATPVLGATQYRFNFSGPGGPFVENSNNYTVFLHNVGPLNGPGLQYNSAVYSVTVQALVNGQWSAPGAACILTMASQPENTEVQASYCGGTYNYPSDPNYILAEYVYGAIGYEWEFTPMSGQSTGVQTTTTAGLSLQFHLTDLDLSEGGDWDVRVRALAEGQNGAFSNACTISIAVSGAVAPPAGEDTVSKLHVLSNIIADVYPNPTNGEQVAINLSELTDENQKIIIEVVDFTGKLVHSEQVANKGANANFIVDFDSKLATGMYFVNIYVNDEMLVEKLTVE